MNDKWVSKGLSDAKVAYWSNLDENRNRAVEAAIRAWEAHKAEGFDWQSAFHKEHADLCSLEANNYVMRKALREIAVATRTHATVSYWTDIEVEMLKDIARKPLGEE